MELYLSVFLDVAELQGVLKSAFSNDILSMFIHLNLDIVHIWVNSQCEVARQCPWSGSPRNEVRLFRPNQRECDYDRWVVGLLVVRPSFEVRQDRRAPCGIRHDPRPSVHEPLIKNLLEGPPDALHEVSVHGLVVSLEVDPSAEAPNDVAPLPGVSHDDLSALLIIGLDAHVLSVLGGLDLFSLVDLVFDRKAMAVPSEPSLDVVAFHCVVASDDILKKKSEYSQNIFDQEEVMADVDSV